MKHNFKFFIKEGAGNMFSHGFMSFAAVGVTVACLLIMGTFTLVAYNANENLADLQQENAVLAFVDDSLTEKEAKALQTKLEKVDNVADCTFMSRDEAKENYIEKYDGDELYGDLPADVFRHRYVIHVTDPDRIMETKTAVEQVTGIAKARADQAVNLQIMVTNTSARAVTETVQLYASDPVARITRPARWLIDFQQVPLGPGETRTLRFRVTADQFSYPLAPSLEAAEWVRDPGLIQLHVGPNSRDTQTVELTWLD